MNILFFGTPDFAVPTLHAIANSNHTISCVITAPDMPAGRGLLLKMSSVKSVALTYNLPILQPEDLSDLDFIHECRKLQPDVAVVVAFRKLPESVWKIPTSGTFNLHASLLPQYRGAAPINRAIMNGETETGLTTFFITDQIDKGNIIHQVKIPIKDSDTYGSLYKSMADEGAKLVMKTLDDIEKGTAIPFSQEEIIRANRITELKKAPKITREDCVVDWTKSSVEIRNQIRGLSPYPGVFSTLTHSSGKTIQVKIYSAEICFDNISLSPGNIIFAKDKMIVGTGSKSCLLIYELCPESKSVMSVQSFLNGLQSRTEWKFS